MQATEKRQLNTHHQIWLLAALLTILVIVSATLAGTCLYSYAHQSDNEISLYQGNTDKRSQNRSTTTNYTGSQAQTQAKKYDMKVSDTKKVWRTETAVELFKVHYRNGKGEVTVQSSGKDKVIAPGTNGKYSFTLKNTGNGTLDYKVWVETQIDSDNAQIKTLPLEARMSSKKDWLLGSKNEWKQAKDLDGVQTTQVLEAGKQMEYNLYWQWQFERGKDAEDTALGNLSADDTLTYTVKIHTLAAEAKGGKTQPKHSGSLLDRVKTADTADLALWAGIFALAAGMIFVLIIWKKKRESQE